MWDLSVHSMSLPFDHTCSLGKSELETCLRFPVSENRNRKLRSESSFLFPLLPIVQFDVVHQHLGLRHKQHTNSYKTACPESSCSFFSLLVGFFWIHSDSGNFFLQAFLIFFVSHLDICTRFPNWSYISIQNFRWTYERTALPSPFPDC